MVFHIKQFEQSFWMSLPQAKSDYGTASMDGAGKIFQFFKITLPMVSSTLFVVIIKCLMASIKVYDIIYVRRTLPPRVRRPGEDNEFSVCNVEGKFLHRYDF